MYPPPPTHPSQRVIVANWKETRWKQWEAERWRETQTEKGKVNMFKQKNSKQQIYQVRRWVKEGSKGQKTVGNKRFSIEWRMF